jgi:hypothetical protein
VYISLTYPSLTPYLKGIHLTLDSWRPNRDGEGWKRPASQIAAAIGSTLSHPPTHVHVVPRLASDVDALLALFAPMLPPLRRVRPKVTAQVFYGFGNISGSGFGSTI